MGMIVRFETENAAFDDSLTEEAARIMRAIADSLDRGAMEGKVLDANGNCPASPSNHGVGDHDDLPEEAYNPKPGEI